MCFCLLLRVPCVVLFWFVDYPSLFCFVCSECFLVDGCLMSRFVEFCFLLLRCVDCFLCVCLAGGSWHCVCCVGCVLCACISAVVCSRVCLSVSLVDMSTRPWSMCLFVFFVCHCLCVSSVRVCFS